MIYRIGRQYLVWARQSKTDEWQVEPLTTQPFHRPAAVCTGVLSLDQDVGEYVGWLITQHPSRRLPNGGVVKASEVKKWVGSSDHDEYLVGGGGTHKGGKGDKAQDKKRKKSKGRDNKKRKRSSSKGRGPAPGPPLLQGVTRH